MQTIFDGVWHYLQVVDQLPQFAPLDIPFTCLAIPDGIPDDANYFRILGSRVTVVYPGPTTVWAASSPRARPHELRKKYDLVDLTYPPFSREERCTFSCHFHVWDYSDPNKGSVHSTEWHPIGFLDDPNIHLVGPYLVTDALRLEPGSALVEVASKIIYK